MQTRTAGSASSSVRTERRRLTVADVERIELVRVFGAHRLEARVTPTQDVAQVEAEALATTVRQLRVARPRGQTHFHCNETITISNRLDLS